MRRNSIIAILIAVLLIAPAAYYFVGSSIAVSRSRDAERRQLEAIEALHIPGLKRLQLEQETSEWEFRLHWIVDHTPGLSSLEGVILGSDYYFGSYGAGDEYYMAEGSTEQVCQRIAQAVSVLPRDACVPDRSPEDIAWCKGIVAREGRDREDLCQQVYNITLPSALGFSSGDARISRVLVNPSNLGRTPLLPDASQFGHEPGNPATLVEIDYEES